MDMVYILENSICCYRYSRNLRARAQFIDDPRFYPDRWSCEDAARYRAEEAAYLLAHDGGDEPSWRESLFQRYRALEPDKTLVVLDYSDEVGALMLTQMQRLEASRGDHAAVFSFFHSDTEMESLLWSNWTSEEMIQDKVDWLSTLMNYSFIKTVEIDYNYTLSEPFLKKLYREHARPFRS